ncbi:MAG: zinc-binding dehydrogenase [Planctomycetota bacterium]|jgi:6-hydroxycyclohex-1-ene-1-carbonyl-CoA dehydrogenase
MADMKAAMFLGPEKPLEIQDVPVPEIGPDEVLVKVAGCGVCHTDLHYIDHGTPTFKKPPFILGHEPSGTVSAVGANVKNWKEGNRVLLPAVLSCGVCENCRIGRENICYKMVMFGNHVDGAYAEYVKAPAKDIFELPEELPLEESCIIADAVSTPFHAVKNRAKVRPGDYVVVVGCGGVGMNTVQVATAAGATVIACDISAEKRDLAKKFGASYVVDPGTDKDANKAAIREIKKITKGVGADIAMEVIGKAVTQNFAFNTLKMGGRLVVIGFSTEKLSVSGGKVMFFEMDVIGSLGCRPVDYPRIIELARTGRINVKDFVTSKHKLEDINKAFDLLREGKGLRAVITP